MHQHISILNLSPLLRPILTSRDTSKVLKKVTIGIGAFIHFSNAYAHVVVSGSISPKPFNFGYFLALFTRM